MRGEFADQGGLFSYVPRGSGPASHPLRKFRELIRNVLGELTRGEGSTRAKAVLSRCARLGATRASQALFYSVPAAQSAAASPATASRRKLGQGYYFQTQK